MTIKRIVLVVGDGLTKFKMQQCVFETEGKWRGEFYSFFHQIAVGKLCFYDHYSKMDKKKRTLDNNNLCIKVGRERGRPLAKPFSTKVYDSSLYTRWGILGAWLCGGVIIVVVGVNRFGEVGKWMWGLWIGGGGGGGGDRHMKVRSNVRREASIVIVTSGSVFPRGSMRGCVFVFV